MAPSPNLPSHHDRYMLIALALAKRGIGCVAPNPSVGCVIVKDNVIVGRGRTQDGGRPHAERMALQQAVETAKGADVYVTLEPCAHTGNTPPCADALIDAGVARVFIATLDQDERVAGKGVKALEDAGIETHVGALSDQAYDLNKGFFLRFEEDRPFYSSKIASSVDGRIALSSGESKWITGANARAYGHILRARHDAILVGVNTVIADNPSLTCRLEGLEGISPIRIILDKTLRTPADSVLVSTACDTPTLIVTEQADTIKQQPFVAAGVKFLAVEDINNISMISKALVDEGITRVLIEGGGMVHASFIKAGVVDRIEHFIGGSLIGGDGLPAVGSMNYEALSDTPKYESASIRQLGADILASWNKSE